MPTTHRNPAIEALEITFAAAIIERHSLHDTPVFS